MSSSQTRIFIFNNNPHCEGRGVDAAHLVNYFKRNNCRLLDRPDQADFIVIFTCAFSNPIEDYYLDLIQRFRLHRYKGEIIVTGCLPAIAPAKLSRVFRGRTITTCDLPAIDQIFPWFEIPFRKVPDANTCHYSKFVLPDPWPVKADKFLNLTRKSIREFEWSPRYLKRGSDYLKTHLVNQFARFTQTTQPITPVAQKRHGIRIGSGCLGKCSYCGIRKAIGPLKSKPLEACLAEYRRLLAAGHRDFVIGSEDTGAYGHDIGSSLPQLLEAMGREDKGTKTRWYLTSLKPVWLLEFKSRILALARGGKLSHLECPLQSGSERILKRMNRPVDMNETEKVLTAIRKAAPGIVLITHIIVGFPSETDHDFTQTMNLLEHHAFQSIILNAYDDKPQSAAARMKDKVAADVIAARYAVVRAHMAANHIAPIRPGITRD